MEPLHALHNLLQYRIPTTKHNEYVEAHLELLSSISVESPIIVENVDKLEAMALAHFVIVGVVRGRDLDSTGTELHVNDDIVRYDGDLAVDEGVLDELAV